MRVKISRWETGRNVPEELSRELLCAAFGCSEQDLGFDESAAPLEGLGHPPATHRGIITPESLSIYDSLLEQYARLDALAGPRAAIGPVREHLRNLEGLLVQADTALKGAVARLGARYTEMAGWLAQDSGDHVAAASWSAKAAGLASQVDDPLLTSYVWMRRSNVATDAGYSSHARHAAEGHAAEGLLFAEGALSRPEHLPANLQALAYRQRAHAHALAGQDKEADRAIDHALAIADQSGEESGLAPYCSLSYVRSEAASAMVRLGRPDRAVELLTDALLAWPADQARDRGIGLARLARAQLLAGELDHACALGHDATSAIESAVSARALSELERLRVALTPKRDRAAAQLSDRLRPVLLR
ncbi:hypothetical protein ACWEV3_01170 [Saccharopolyspora sp. NPDC003752]